MRHTIPHTHTSMNFGWLQFAAEAASDTVAARGALLPLNVNTLVFVIGAVLVAISVVRWFVERLLSLKCAARFSPNCWGASIVCVALFMVVQTAPGGLLPHSAILALCLTLATQASWGAHHTCHPIVRCLIFFALICGTIHRVVPALVPPINVSNGTAATAVNGRFSSPFAGAVMQVVQEARDPFGCVPTVHDDQSMPSRLDVAVYHDDITLSPLHYFDRRRHLDIPQAVLIQRNLSIISTGRFTTIRLLDLTLQGRESGLVLFGDHTSLQNVTLRCSGCSPCLWVTARSAASLSIEDSVVMVNGSLIHLNASLIAAVCRRTAQPSSATPSRTEGPLDVSNVMHCMVIEDEENVFRAVASTTTMERFPTEPFRRYSANAPWIVMAMHDAPLIFGTVRRGVLWLSGTVVEPSLSLVWRWGVVAYLWCKPWLMEVERGLWKVAAVLVCRYRSLTLSPNWLDEYCDKSSTYYRHDKLYNVMLTFTEAVEVAVRDFEGIPVVSRTLAWAWNAELLLASALWNLSLRGIQWLWRPELATAVATQLLLPVVEWTWRLLTAAAAVVWWSLVVTFPLGSSVAIDFSFAVLRALTALVSPLWSLLVMIVGSVWSVWKVYTNTSFSVQLIVALGQTALLAFVLWKDFKERLEAKKGKGKSSIWSWVSDASVAPVVIAAMTTQYSGQAILYGALHLVAILLALGTSVIPFGSKLFAFCLSVVFPLSSTYGWTAFFVDRTEAPRRFWFKVAIAMAIKVPLSIVLQKTIGDVVYHLLSDIITTLVIGGALLGGTTLYLRRAKAARQQHLISAAAVNAPLHEEAFRDEVREIH